jgi:hypothetical protein
VPKFDEDGNLIGGIRGVDEKNNPLDDAYLVGTCYIAELTGEEYTEIKSHYPYLDIKYGKMTSTVTFMSTTGDAVLYTEVVTNINSETGNCTDPVLTNKITKPTKASTDEFDYEWAGWSRKVNSEIHADALLAITGDRVLYPAFRAIRRNYTVTFINPTAPEGSQFLAEIITPYGSDADYLAAGYSTPEKLDAAAPSLYAFVGWYPKPEKITGNLTCYAQFTILDSAWYTVGIGDFGEYLSNNTVQIGHILNSDGTIKLTKYNNYLNKAVLVPNNLEANGQQYLVTHLGGFNAHTELELIKLPESLTTLLNGAFTKCINLYEIVLPNSLKTIEARALNSCNKLKELTIPASVTTIDEIALAECPALSKISVAEGNSTFIVVQDCLVDVPKKKLLQGLATSIIPQDGSITSLGQYCFAYIPIKTVKIPDSIKVVSNNAFGHCSSLSDVELPNTLKELSDACFSWCSSLSKINLPEGLTDIKTYAFNECTLDNVIIPSTVTNIMERAFGFITTLKTVTFRKAIGSDGNIKLPYIHSKAFNSSGSVDNPIIFNLPWSEEQHNSRYSGLDEQGNQKDPTFGAAYYTFNFNYEEAN